ncbi:hypothetical protein A7982_13688 [Minicystis rosea]|nr:hypothetical protein A7982_13688 [Minicystis rosea]
MFGLVRFDPYVGCNFLVVSTAFVVGGFREVSGLSGQVEVKTYAEGGRNGYLHQIPGEVRWPNLVLSRGVIDSNSMWSWFEDVSRGIIERHTLTIMLLDRDRSPAMWWEIRDAIPVKWAGPTLNATSDEIAVESVELVHKGIKKPALSKLVTDARAAADIARALAAI